MVDITKNGHEETITFKVVPDEKPNIREIIRAVYAALQEKGYNATNQLVGYLLSGDPTYITSHNNARNLIRKVERDELIEELVSAYIRADSARQGGGGGREK